MNSTARVFKRQIAHERIGDEGPPLQSVELRLKLLRLLAAHLPRLTLQFVESSQVLWSPGVTVVDVACRSSTAAPDATRRCIRG